MYRFNRSTHLRKMVIFRTFVAFFPLAGHIRRSLCLLLPQYWQFCSCFCCFLSVRPDRLPVCSRPWSARYRWRPRPFPLLIASTACVVWLLIACACDWLNSYVCAMSIHFSKVRVDPSMIIFSRILLDRTPNTMWSLICSFCIPSGYPQSFISVLSSVTNCSNDSESFCILDLKRYLL